METRTVVVGAAVTAGVGGVALWARYLWRRQGVWRVRNAEAIPVHSKFWRERNKEEGELLYAVIGDSAAQGIGASRPAHGYVGFVAAQLRSLLRGRSLRVANLAISGSTLRMAIDSQLPRFAALDPDVVTVSIGANDMGSFEPERFERELRTVLGAMPQHAIVADLPSFYFLPAQRNVRAANRILRRVAGELGLRVVDLHSRTDRQGLFGVFTQFSGDLFHPNDRGYRIWADAFSSAITARANRL